MILMASPELEILIACQEVDLALSFLCTSIFAHVDYACLYCIVSFSAASETGTIQVYGIYSNLNCVAV